jgi:GntR family transcriptional regulator / MocR family aminotransferase
VVDAAARRGLGAHGLAPYGISGEGDGGLIFGYATLNERTMTEGIDILAAAISEVHSV